MALNKLLKLFLPKLCTYQISPGAPYMSSAVAMANVLIINRSVMAQMTVAIPRMKITVVRILSAIFAYLLQFYCKCYAVLQKLSMIRQRLHYFHEFSWLKTFV